MDIRTVSAARNIFLRVRCLSTDRSSSLRHTNIFSQQPRYWECPLDHLTEHTAREPLRDRDRMDGSQYPGYQSNVGMPGTAPLNEVEGGQRTEPPIKTMDE